MPEATNNPATLQRLDEAFAAFKAERGMMQSIDYLISAMLKLQRENDQIRRTEYVGDEFKIIIKLKDKPYGSK